MAFKIINMEDGASTQFAAAANENNCGESNAAGSIWDDADKNTNISFEDNEIIEAIVVVDKTSGAEKRATVQSLINNSAG